MRAPPPAGEVDTVPQFYCGYRISGRRDVTSSIEGVICLTISSRYDDSVRFTIQPLVVNRITNELPTANTDHTRLDYLNDLPLADFKYYKPANIDIILGSVLFARILRHKTVSRGTTEPAVVETLLANLVLGEAPEVPDVSLLTPEEDECELIYSSTVKRKSSGRYVTVIPFIGDPNTLGDSLQSAARRYYCLERKLLSNPQIKEEHDKVYIDYLNKGYFKPVIDPPNLNFSKQYITPHHCVCRLRQMYLQISTNVNHHRWQRLLHRFNTNDSLQLFEMTRIPFGLRSSPYIANRTVRQLIIDEPDRYPLAAERAQKYLYMDDLASSYPSENEAIESELPLLENVQLSRHVGVTANCTISILGFADASEKAYGTFPARGRAPVGRTVEGVIHPLLYRPEHFREELSVRVKRPTASLEEEEKQPTAENESPSKTDVHRWFDEFKRGRVTLTDEERSARPLSAITKEKASAVKRLI
ncbi:hypothetical protein EVAR_54620_1 [Eumeta japonica]|uniref:Reverse transcriptase domain-containing protein n=1 Tax=Eumeta variegata TaxID=151549 RepID=A0A4C1YNK1_EUMVA|nr:hypothetical protein EVAR_54620_1 [Eumeta japonica]